MTRVRPTLNLGILAHVDAGKTSLTERLLYAAGVTDHVGRVDDGDTQTDTLDLERRRGITIRAAVASFLISDVRVNLLDTPGHPDFIAEVERVLGVLDGAVLVVSAVEGVQAQTRVLMRTLRRLRIPTTVFVNKVDRRGADPDGVLASLGPKLGLATVAMGRVTDAGTTAAAVHHPEEAAHRAALIELLTVSDDDLLGRYLRGSTITTRSLRARLAGQARSGLVHPVFFGSATTGAGVELIMPALVELLPVTEPTTTGELSGSVFKIERGSAGEKICYARMFDGVLSNRTRIPLPHNESGRPTNKITELRVYDGGPAAPAEEATPGQIAMLWGLTDFRVGDAIGRAHRPVGDAFARPTLETMITSRDPADAGRLHSALSQLAEQDPLIDFRRRGDHGLALSLYGQVQQEVIEATLAEQYGLAASFAEPQVICVERVLGSGHRVESIGEPDNPYFATIGLRVAPGPPGSGVHFTQETAVHGTLPLAFVNAIAETVADSLQAGVHGWEVLDVVVTLTHTGYYPRQSHSHAKFDKSMSSVGSDFRGLTPLVLLAALRDAGTEVCEPIARITLTVPADTLGLVLPVLGRLGAVPDPPQADGDAAVVSATLAVAAVQELTAQLPGLTHGEGFLESVFDHFAPVHGAPPRRSRPGPDPFDRRTYLLQVKR